MKILIFTPFIFNVLEFYGSLDELLDEDIEFTVLSTENIIYNENNGEPVKVHGLINEFFEKYSVNDYDALIVTGGPNDGLLPLWYDKDVEKIVCEFNAKKKFLGGICRTMVCIRYAVRDKKYTSFPVLNVKRLMDQAGGKFVDKSIVIDDNIITAGHQMITRWWMRAIIALMKGEEPNTHLTDCFESMTEKYGKNWQAKAQISAKRGDIRWKTT